jgi:hypothetical protein
MESNHELLPFDFDETLLLEGLNADTDLRTIANEIFNEEPKIVDITGHLDDVSRSDTMSWDESSSSMFEVSSGDKFSSSRTSLQTSNEVLLCKVCNRPAGKHNYYGGKVRLVFFLIIFLIV